MKSRIRKSIILISLSGIVLPFVLITDLFPFMRFGMFAEPVRSPVQSESFILTYTDTQGKERILDPKDIGIEPHFFYYLTRNYYYRNEAKEMLGKVNTIKSDPWIREWKLKRITIREGIHHVKDTSIVARRINE